MFFLKDDISITFLSILKLSRKNSRHESVSRCYDSISIRLSGSCKFKTGNKEYKIKSGDLLYIPQNADYVQETSEETIIAVHFLSNTAPGKKIELVHIENFQPIVDIFTAMYKLCNEKPQGYRYECTAMLYHLFYLVRNEIQDDIINSVDIHGRIKKATDYIHTNYRRKNISVKELAEMSAVSDVYFRSLFKKIYLVSPNKYITLLRLEYAAQLLQSNLYTISEVSEKSGYNNVKYFERLFKNHYGQTPGEYKKTDIEKNIY